MNVMEKQQNQYEVNPSEFGNITSNELKSRINKVKKLSEDYNTTYNTYDNAVNAPSESGSFASTDANQPVVPARDIETGEYEDTQGLTTK